MLSIAIFNLDDLLFLQRQLSGMRTFYVYWIQNNIFMYFMNETVYIVSLIFVFISVRNTLHITKTCLYNFDPLKPHFYIVKLGFTGVYIIFLISAQNIDCGYSLKPPRWGGSNEYPQSMFWAEIWKLSEFFIWKFSVFGDEIFYIFE